MLKDIPTLVVVLQLTSFFRMHIIQSYFWLYSSYLLYRTLLPFASCAFDTTQRDFERKSDIKHVDHRLHDLKCDKMREMWRRLVMEALVLFCLAC